MMTIEKRLNRMTTILCVILTVFLGGIAAADGRGLSFFKTMNEPNNRTAAGVYIISLNSATLEELEMLDGIGKVLAGRILEYRNEKGNFQTIDQLTEVEGIGPLTLEKIRHHLLL
jgi:competence ComEA-like helix-hairpin-helix protein